VAVARPCKVASSSATESTMRAPRNENSPEHRAAQARADRYDTHTHAVTPRGVGSGAADVMNRKTEGKPPATPSTGPNDKRLVYPARLLLLFLIYLCRFLPAQLSLSIYRTDARQICRGKEGEKKGEEKTRWRGST